MKFYSNQDAFGWIVLLLSCFAFVACGAREGERGASTQTFWVESSQTPTFDAFSASRFDVAFAPDSEISEFLRLSTRRSFSCWSSRRPRMVSNSARVFQTPANRLTFERVGQGLFSYRPFWTSSFPSLPLFLSFLTLRN